MNFALNLLDPSRCVPALLIGSFFLGSLSCAPDSESEEALWGKDGLFGEFSNWQPLTAFRRNESQLCAVDDYGDPRPPDPPAGCVAWCMKKARAVRDLQQWVLMAIATRNVLIGMRGAPAVRAFLYREAGYNLANYRRLALARGLYAKHWPWTWRVLFGMDPTRRYIGRGLCLAYNPLLSLGGCIALNAFVVHGGVEAIEDSEFKKCMNDNNFRTEEVLLNLVKFRIEGEGAERKLRVFQRVKAEHWGADPRSLFPWLIEGITQNQWGLRECEATSPWCWEEVPIFDAGANQYVETTELGLGELDAQLVDQPKQNEWILYMPHEFNSGDVETVFRPLDAQTP